MCLVVFSQGIQRQAQRWLIYPNLISPYPLALTASFSAQPVKGTWKKFQLPYPTVGRTQRKEIMNENFHTVVDSGMLGWALISTTGKKLGRKSQDFLRCHRLFCVRSRAKFSLPVANT